ncbi:MAG: DUF3067 family protein [Cyanobacteria bacterium P01_E01_bin.42]
MTGDELKELLLKKWGRSYDVRFRQTKGTIYVQVMWKYLEQQSFPLTAAEYTEHLQEVAAYLNAWGGVSQVREYIEKTRERPRLGKAVSIPLDLGERTSEWIIGDI